jgi:hypothetical protein
MQRPLRVVVAGAGRAPRICTEAEQWSGAVAVWP